MIRHASTEWNEAKRIQGQSNSRLSAAGEQAARQWGERLQGFGWQRILASDLGRTLRTADLINERLKLPLLTDERLREQRWGNWEGNTIDQIVAENAAELTRYENMGWRFRPPGGEDRLQVWQRSRTALETAALHWPEETILVITHEGVIKALVYRLLQRRFLPSEPGILKRGHLHWLTFDDSGLKVHRLNAVDLMPGS